ncbi:dCMP deaminase family protein [Hydrogenophaga sp. H7]|uniref:deoxycytidylate deaminase n=1 Tax=Hydrogenophaga sp. H7 TaxID=1882399 RepID=UPI0009A366CD
MSNARTNHLDWDHFFMGVALLAAARSKDPKTQNGACVVSTKQKILGVGYNGLPVGCDDRDPIFWLDDDDDAYHSKHSYVVHAEINAILNCAILPIDDAVMYTTQFPCVKCTQAIIQAGIRQIKYLHSKKLHTSQNAAAQKMLDASGVKYVQLSEDLISWSGGLTSYLSTQKGGPSWHT